MATTFFPIEPVNNFSFSPIDDLSNKDVFREKSEQQYRSVIVTLFSNKKTMCLTFPTNANITIFDIKQIVYKRLLLEPKDQYFYTTSGKLLNDNASIFENENEEFVNVNLRIRILGGKGGFGSMLRAQGGKMASQKTTNFEACRDLNGRRLRTVNEARRLADHLEQEPERQRAQREKVKKKIEEGLREPPTKKHRFDDTAYLKASEEMKEKVQNTVAEALQKPGVNKNDASIGSSKNTIASLSMWDVEISDYDSGGSDDNDTGIEDNLEDTASKKKEKGKGKDKDTKKRRLSEI